MAGEEFATIVEQLRRGELRMPAVPRVLIDLRALVRKPDATVEEVASLIERDQRTAAQVIRLANSALSTGLTRVNDIRGAITRIGFRQVENLAEASFAQGCYRIADARFRPLQSKLWRYSLARAVAMRALAEAAGPASGLDPALAYLAGLMGDSGAAFLLWLTAERERTSPSALIGDALVDCLAQIRTHHEELGGAMMRKWGMDPVIASVAETHHASQPPAPANRYWSLTVLASDLANQLAPGDDITRSHTTGAALLERAGNELRIGDSLLKRVLAKLSKEIDAILDTLAA